MIVNRQLPLITSLLPVISPQARYKRPCSMYWNEFDIFHDVYKLVIVIDYFSASDSSIIFVIGLFLDNHFFSFTVKML